MTYDLLFDLAEYGYRDGVFWLIGAAIGVVAGLAWAIQRRRRGKQTVPGMLAFAALFCSVGAGGVPMWDHHRLVAEYNAGRALVVEGLVSSHSVQLHTTRRSDGKGYDRRTWESFRVGEIAFGFDHEASPVTRQAREKQLPGITDGQRLRVHYVDDAPGDYSQRRIVRLERVQ